MPAYAFVMMDEPREVSQELYRPFGSITEWGTLDTTQAWKEFAFRLEAARRIAQPRDLQRSLDITLRSAALETGALEGLYVTNRGVTRTVAVQGALWEAELSKLGPDVKGHFDAQLAAFDLVLDAATTKLEITESWLRELHANVCAAQKTHKVLTEVGWQEHRFPHGQYKTSSNNVTLADGTTHWYAPVVDVPSEMHRLMVEMRSEAFREAHPVIQAAFAHHALTAVHPFADGNGRTARALSSVFLYRSIGIPLVIFADQQMKYWDALALADAGRFRQFKSFIEDRAMDTMALVTNALQEARLSLDDQVNHFRALLRAHGGMTHAAVQTIGIRLVEIIQNRLLSRLENLALRPDIDISVERKPDGIACSFWDRPYHALIRQSAFAINLQCLNPVRIQTQMTPFVGVANDKADPFTYIVIDANRNTVTPLLLRLTDIDPSLSATAESLIDGWTKRVISEAMDDLTNGLSQALSNEGF